MGIQTSCATSPARKEIYSAAPKLSDKAATNFPAYSCAQRHGKLFNAAGSVPGNSENDSL